MPHTQIHVFGHTDSTGTDTHDDALSDARAGEVKNYFISSGIPADIITAKGMGNANRQAFPSRKGRTRSEKEMLPPNSVRRTGELKS